MSLAFRDFKLYFPYASNLLYSSYRWITPLCGCTSRAHCASATALDSECFCLKEVFPRYSMQKNVFNKFKFSTNVLPDVEV